MLAAPGASSLGGRDRANSRPEDGCSRLPSRGLRRMRLLDYAHHPDGPSPRGRGKMGRYRDVPAISVERGFRTRSGRNVSPHEIPSNARSAILRAAAPTPAQTEYSCQKRRRYTGVCCRTQLPARGTIKRRSRSIENRCQLAFGRRVWRGNESQAAFASSADRP